LQEENGGEEDGQLSVSFSKEQTETADQPREEWHTPTGELQITRVQICTHL
jgi:hypothetical protein